MAEQHSLSDDELRDAFDKAKGEQRATLDQDGTAAILRHLGTTVGKMQEIGVNISIQVISGDHASAYDMMYTTNSSHTMYGSSINAYGFIRIGETQHLFAIANKLGETEVSQLYLSKFNTGEAAGRQSADGKAKTHAAIPGEIYDFRSDPEALKKFQKKLVEIAAQEAVVMENDPAEIFNAPPAPYTKPAAPKLRP